MDGRFGDGKSEAHGKYSAKEGVRPNQARPQTNIQVRFLAFETGVALKLASLSTVNCYSPKLNICFQTLDGKFGDGKSEAHGKYSAKEGVRPNQARPQTNIQVFPHNNCFFLQFLNLLLLVQPTGRAEGESETQDRQIICQTMAQLIRECCNDKDAN